MSGTGIIGFCFDCPHSGHMQDIKWNMETGQIICRAFPDGAPKDVMNQLEQRGYCRMKNKDLMEIFEAELKEQIDKEMKKEMEKIEEEEKKNK